MLYDCIKHINEKIKYFLFKVLTYIQHVYLVASFITVIFINIKNKNTVTPIIIKNFQF